MPAAQCQCIFCWTLNILVLCQIFSFASIWNVLNITEYLVYAEYSVFCRILWSFSDQNIWVSAKEKSVSVNHCIVIFSVYAFVPL